jgi:hypothetical protein
MPSGHDAGRPPRAEATPVLRPDQWRRGERHIRLGVSHPSGDPALHRVFEVRAVFDDRTGGWVAQVGEQNLNEQRGAWEPLPPQEIGRRILPTPAACLGEAVATIIAAVDQEAAEV